MIAVAQEPVIDTAIQVFDDVLVDPHGYRAAALAQPFGDVPAGDQLFHGMSPCLDPQVTTRITTDLRPGARVTLSFFRKSPEGQQEPNFIHSDREMGDWTGILYLNPDPAPGDGTSFWRHRVTGTVCGEFDDVAARDPALWERWRHVEAKFGRLLIFQSDYFHSRGIEANYGQGEDARLIQVIFGKNAALAGAMVIRSASFSDIPQVVEMGRRFLASTEYRGRIAENTNQMAHVASFLLQAPDRALFVAERAGRLVGMIGLVLFPQPLSGELMAGEWFWWVEPDARHGRAGHRLLKQAEDWARESGAAALQMIAPNAEVERIYATRGYERVEVSYQRRLT